jgi:dipeptidyl aminopeptidase/acylaminoacyl peptidase
MDVTRFTELKRVGRVAPSPCGTWLAVEVARLARDESKYVTDLWRVDLDGGKQPRQLTIGEVSDRAPRFRRDGSLAFVSDRPLPGAEGEPRPQIWLLPAGGGEPAPLTDEPLGVLDYRFAASANVLVVLAPVLPGVPGDKQRSEAEARTKRGPSLLRYTEMPVRHWDHWIPTEQPRMFAYDESGQGRRALTPTATDELRDYDFGLGWDLAADGSAVVTQAASLGPDRIHDVRLELIDVASCERRVLAAAPRAEMKSPRFSPSGQRIAFTRWQRVDGELVLSELAAVDRDGEPLALSAPLIDPKELDFAGEDTVIYTADHAGDVPLFAAAIGGGEGWRVSAGHGTHHGISTTAAGHGHVAVGVRHTLLHPPEPFACDVAEGAEPRVVAVLSGINAEHTARIAELERCATTAADGSEVPWFLLKPRDAAGPSPALLWIHGGPIGQWSDGWHWRWNPLLMVAAGYAVALPNPRGSTGLGNDFANGVWNNRWGAECYTDLVSVTDDLAGRGDIDADRIGAMGGSFGGYMANWIGGQTDRFRCLVSHAGLYHLPAFHGTTDHPAFFTHEQGCDPYSDPEAFSRFSPHAFVATWKSPVLIIHGERDFRVPVSEALLLFERLRAQGVDAELAIFPDENHWILKPHNARAWYGEVLRFLSEKLD